MTNLPQNIQKIKTIFIGITGILSGLGFLQYIEFLTNVNISSTGYTSFIWWAIPVSVSTCWILLRLYLRQSYVTILGAMFYFSIVSYWLFTENYPIFISSIFYRDDNILGPFVFAGLLTASLVVIEIFLFSQSAVKFVALTLFSILFVTQIIPALTNIYSTKIQTFLMSLLVVSILSSIWIVASELLFFIIAELFQKAGMYAEKE